jgi:hypothetical protein
MIYCLDRNILVSLGPLFCFFNKVFDRVIREFFCPDLNQNMLKCLCVFRPFVTEMYARKPNASYLSKRKRHNQQRLTSYLTSASNFIDIRAPREPKSSTESGSIISQYFDNMD